MLCGCISSRCRRGRRGTSNRAVASARRAAYHLPAAPVRRRTISRRRSGGCMKIRLAHLALVLPLLIAVAAPVIPQGQQASGRVYTKADYDNAAKFLGGGFNGLVTGGTVNATWLPDERFWYRATLADGTAQTIIVNPVAKTKTVCTPAIAECANLTEAGGAGAGGRGAGGRGGRAGGGGGGGRGGAGGGAPLNTSPDGKRGVFIRDWNLWVRDVATGAERQLTKDGIENFGYAT